MTRIAAYAGTSILLAGGVIVRALHKRANFYSASIYIAQSNACLMVLTNLLLLGLSVCMIALQRLAYGPLRVIEVEQLYEKAWFAITETCLAMTIFRDEIGGWFLVMFISLLIGKVWNWLGEGRLEVLDQQPPSNPRLFHLRLSFSLALAVLFDLFMLRYTVQTIQDQAEPNMMVMFAFEFAVLSVMSLSSTAKYALFLHERAIIKEQTRMRRLERTITSQREARHAEETTNSDDNTTVRPYTVDQHDVQDMANEEIDVPGWETKGFWIFYLDLLTDFLKLVLYLSFFSVLCVFYGMPLHIIRDVAITVRSFYKRIHDFLRYRQATKDMNERYADATREEMAIEDVCIICRETMTAWTNTAEAREASQAALRQQDQRLRPKKLPCGHILHFACLRSWLERQQNCPTCRRPVLSTTSLVQVANIQTQPQRNQLDNPVAGEGFPANRNGDRPRHRENRVRFFNFGPLRLGIGAGPDLQGLADHINHAERRPQPSQLSSAEHSTDDNAIITQGARVAPTNLSSDSVQRQLQAIEHELMQQIGSLRVQADQLFLVRTLQGELARIRMSSQNSGIRQSGLRTSSDRPLAGSTQASATTFQPAGVTALDPRALPPGVVLPEGWTLMPLRRIADGPVDVSNTSEASLSSQTSERISDSSPITHRAGPLHVGIRVSGDTSIVSDDSHHVRRPTTTNTISDNAVNDLRPATHLDDLSSVARSQTSSGSAVEKTMSSTNPTAANQTGLSETDFVRISNKEGRALTPDETLEFSTRGKHVTIEDHEDDST